MYIIYMCIVYRYGLLLLYTVSAPLCSAVALVCSAVDVAFALMCSACAFKPLHFWRGTDYSVKASALVLAISLSTMTSQRSAPLRKVRQAISSAANSSLAARKNVAIAANMLCLRSCGDIPVHT